MVLESEHVYKHARRVVRVVDEGGPGVLVLVRLRFMQRGSGKPRGPRPTSHHRPIKMTY